MIKRAEVGVGGDERFDRIPVAARNSRHKGGPSALIFGVNIRPPLEKQFYGMRMAAAGRMQKRSQASRIGAVHARSLPKKTVDFDDIALRGGRRQSFLFSFIEKKHIPARLFDQSILMEAG
jgi:hypothetical protein